MHVENCRHTFGRERFEMFDKGNSENTRGALRVCDPGQLKIKKRTKIDQIYKPVENVMTKYRTKNRVRGW